MDLLGIEEGSRGNGLLDDIGRDADVIGRDPDVVGRFAKMLNLMVRGLPTEAIDP